MPKFEFSLKFAAALWQKLNKKCTLYFFADGSVAALGRYVLEVLLQLGPLGLLVVLLALQLRLQLTPHLLGLELRGSFRLQSFAILNEGGARYQVI